MTTFINNNNNSSVSIGYSIYESNIDDAVYVQLQLLMGVLLLVGFIFNSIVLIVWIFSSKLKSQSYLLMAQLTLADLLLCIIAGIQHVYVASSGGWLEHNVDDSNGIHSSMYIPRFSPTSFICVSQGLIAVSMCNQSISSLTLIAIQRYLSICHDYLLSTSQLLLFSALSWIISIVYGCLGVFGAHSYTVAVGRSMCLYDWSQRIGVNVLPGVIGLGVMSFTLTVTVICYVLIFMKVKATTATAAAYRRTAQQQKAHELEIAISLRMAKLVALFLVCWLPYGLLMFYETFTGIHASAQWDLSAAFLGHCNSVLNPVLYAYLDPKVKHETYTFFSMHSYIRRNGNVQDIEDQNVSTDNKPIKRAGMGKVGVDVSPSHHVEFESKNHQIQQGEGHPPDS